MTRAVQLVSILLQTSADGVTEDNRDPRGRHQSTPSNYTGRKDDSRVERDEAHKSKDKPIDGLGPCHIIIQPAPPPDNVHHPEDREGVVRVQPAAPIQPDDLGRSSRRCFISGRVAPVMIELEGTNNVQHERKATNGPCQPR